MQKMSCRKKKQNVKTFAIITKNIKCDNDNFALWKHLFSLVKEHQFYNWGQSESRYRANKKKNKQKHINCDMATKPFREKKKIENNW